MAELTKTLVIDNFHGSMTPYIDGDINSGLTNVVEVFGYDPFTKPRNLTWEEDYVQIDSAGSVITGLILAGKGRMESGINYVYAIDHTGRLYKIQVNDPTTYNPNYDNPVLLATLSAQSPTFLKGAFIDFYGATERIYIGHDKGVTRIDFDGTNETFVGTLGSWTQNVPRPLVQFLGNLYAGNGANIAEIIQAGTVSFYTKLSPAFPAGTEVRDLDVTPDGTYLQAVVNELELGDVTDINPPTSITLPSTSYIFKWNGTDTGYTSYQTYPSTSLSANSIFGENAYAFGYDLMGGGIYNPIRKFLTSLPSSAFGESPWPNAVRSLSNMMTWTTTLPFEGNMEGLMTMFGTLSEHELQQGYWAPLSTFAGGDETDVIRIPCVIVASNYAQGPSSNGYTDGIFGVQKIYFSQLETSDTPTTAYRFYSWSFVPVGLGTATVGAVYQTQNQIFSKKIRPTQVRVYGEPWIADNSFIVDLIGSAGTPISGGSKTFTAGTNLTVGDDFAWYAPAIAPTYTLGLRITNNGTANHVINKVEIDYTFAGQ